MMQAYALINGNTPVYEQITISLNALIYQYNALLAGRTASNEQDEAGHPVTPPVIYLLMPVIYVAY